MAAAPATRGPGPLRAALLFAVFLLALVVRWHYVERVELRAGITGDEQMHGFYALNLVARGTFSSSSPRAEAVPDSFRSPGLPLLVAFAMAVEGRDDLSWYALTKRMQAVFGALAVAVLVLFARLWLSWRWALGVGVAAALWPHSIALAGHALVEVPYGLALSLAALASAHAAASESPWRHAGAGLAWSVASMFNPVALGALPAMLVLVPGRRPRLMLAFLLAALSLPVAWGLRETSGAQHATTVGRAAMNVSLGSWPNYHDDWRATHVHGDAEAKRRLAIIVDESMRAAREPLVVLPQIAARLAADPAAAAAWYFLRKPWRLWDWSMRIGQGDLQVVALAYSPFVAEPAYRALAATARTVNPLLFLLTLPVLFVALRPKYACASGPGRSLAICAAIVLSLSAVHVALEAEPRYATPMRGFEIALAATALAAASRRLARDRASGHAPSPAP